MTKCTEASSVLFGYVPPSLPPPPFFILHPPHPNAHTHTHTRTHAHTPRAPPAKNHQITFGNKKLQDDVSTGRKTATCRTWEAGSGILRDVKAAKLYDQPVRL